MLLPQNALARAGGSWRRGVPVRTRRDGDALPQ
jgi:hypothetical protein